MAILTFILVGILFIILVGWLAGKLKDTTLAIGNRAKLEERIDTLSFWAALGIMASALTWLSWIVEGLIYLIA